MTFKMIGRTMTEVNDSPAYYRAGVFRFAEVKARIYEAERSGTDADALYAEFSDLEAELNALERFQS